MKRSVSLEGFRFYVDCSKFPERLIEAKNKGNKILH